jgi:uncharacterized protein (DUF433 family)
MTDDLRERITINPEQCGGRPCIRGMRIRVIDILDLYAAGLTGPQILEEMPDLEMDDLTAALRYAAQRLDHPVIAAEEREAWARVSLETLQRAYGDEGPDYALGLIKEANPEYEGR